MGEQQTRQVQNLMLERACEFDSRYGYQKRVDLYERDAIGIKMKCCVCEKKLSKERTEVPPKWYGKFSGWTVIRAICSECIAKPENKDWGRG